ncbi:MAG: SagB/ThcOx family dehydrogenase [Actinomycetota bacterium]
MAEAARIPRRAFLAAGTIALVSACADGAPLAGRSTTASSSTLPSPRQGRAATLDGVLAERRSVREFTDEIVDEEAISRLLWAAQGVTAAWGGRTAPSAGALYPIEVYVATADGLRRYVPDDHGTVDVAREDRRPRIAQATGQETPTAAPVLIVISGVVSRTAAKYGDRAERYVQLEAGHVCQNLLLEATSLGLAAVPMGAFSDDELRDALGVGEDELPLYVVPIGHQGEGG